MKIKSSSWLTVILFTASFLISAAHTRGATACVWRVTNTPAPCYLIGTIHALSGKDYPLPPPYYAAMKDSEQFLFEVAPDSKNDFERKWDVATTYSKQDDIRRHIHKETWTFLQKRFRESNYLGHDFHIGENYVADMTKLRPWAIAWMVWGIHGYSDIFTDNGVDNYISFQAQRARKACDGLETVDEHMKVLTGMADINAEILLLDALVQGDKRRDQFNAMRAAWRKGDLAGLLAIEQRDRILNMAGEMRLLDERNLRWIPKIQATFASGKRTAIVAGAAHFCGRNSVVDLLQRKGYKIEQL